MDLQDLCAGVRVRIVSGIAAGSSGVIARRISERFYAVCTREGCEIVCPAEALVVE